MYGVAGHQDLRSAPLDEVLLLILKLHYTLLFKKNQDTIGQTLSEGNSMIACQYCEELWQGIVDAYPKGTPRSPEVDALVAAIDTNVCFHRDLATGIRNLRAPQGDMRANTPCSRVYYAIHRKRYPEGGGVSREIWLLLSDPGNVPMPPVDLFDAAMMEVAVAALQDERASPAARAAIAQGAAAGVKDSNLARVMRATAADMAELEDPPKRRRRS